MAALIFTDISAGDLKEKVEAAIAAAHAHGDVR
jgi:hypothetical protein